MNNDTIAVITLGVITALLILAMLIFVLKETKSHKRLDLKFEKFQKNASEFTTNSLNQITDDFKKKLSELSSSYAEELSLVKYLEESERAGTPIDAEKFKADALNRANLLRIRQLEAALSSHIAAKATLANDLSNRVTAEGKNQYYSKYGSFEYPNDIKSLKSQIVIEENYVGELNKQLADLKIYRPS